jgi:hypothetical protein
MTDADTKISCKLQTSCSDLNCCLFVDEIQQTFEYQFLFDPCELKLTVAIEKLHHEISLNDAATGKFIVTRI